MKQIKIGTIFKLFVWLACSNLHANQKIIDVLAKKKEFELFERRVNFISQFIYANVGQTYSANYTDKVALVKKLLQNDDVQKIVNLLPDKAQLYTAIHEHLTRGDQQSQSIAQVFRAVVEPDNTIQNPYTVATVYLQQALKMNGITPGTKLTKEMITKIRDFSFVDLSAQQKKFGDELDRAYTLDKEFYEKWKQESPFQEDEIHCIDIAQPAMSLWKRLFG